MPITTSWYDDTQRVVFQKYEGNWTWEELAHAQEVARGMADAAPSPVIMFTDMSQTSFMPQGNVLLQGRATLTQVPKNVSQFIVVIQSRMIEVFTKIALDMFPAMRDRVRFVKTYEEGLKLVETAIEKNAIDS
ncbi:MAG: hypothetical protein GC179_12960 [Anaerolineaceae bacterium]|nr:hypothetical protein [Anaerolineaceae bacterium]